MKNYHGIIQQVHLIDLTQNGIAERAVRQVKEGTSAVLLQSGLNEKWWSDSMECYYHLQDVQDLLVGGKSQIWTKIWGIIQSTNYTIWCSDWISPKLQERQSKNSSMWKKLLRNVSWLCFIRGEFGKKIFWLLSSKNWKKRWSMKQGISASEIHLRRLNAKEVLITQRDEEFVFLVADGSAKFSGRNYEFQEPTLRRESTCKERESHRRISWR